MSEIETLENLKKYLQFLLDNGTHKIFYNDLFWSEKTIDCINAINDLQQENKKLKEGLHKILDLNKRAINCDSQKITIKYLLKQYDLIYETLGELQPGLMKGDKE